MARSRAVVVAAGAAALLGSAAAGWWLGGRDPATVRATVVEVVDGDTLVVRFGGGGRDTVRVLGVDTPETKHPEKGVECFGPEASAYTRARLLGRAVVLERDVEARDPYGRRLAHVVVDGDRFGDELLRLGYARLLVISPNTAHARSQLAAELEARRDQRGMWGAC